MNLKVRLAVLYSLSVFIILVSSGVFISILNENFRKAEFRKRLSLEAQENQLLYASVPYLTAEIKGELNRNAASSLPHEKLVIFDSAFRIVYKSIENPIPKITVEFFEAARKNGQYLFNEGEFECVLLYRHPKGQAIYVLAAALDIFGKRKNDNLKILLTFSVLGGILLSGLMAFFYVKQAIKPLENLKDQIEKINEANLTDRISVRRNNDEITQIAKKFNDMLDRIEHAFEQRKSFVHHASHELRTPLANMLAQTESAINKNLSADEYKKILYSLKDDQQDLIDLTNSLLTLSRYEKIDPSVHWPPMRIDEVLYQTVDFIHLIYPLSRVTVDFENIPDNEEHLVFEGNESLIRSAIQNLIKNAIQYSEKHQVSVTIHAAANGVTVHFDNAGKQLSAKEQEHLFIPFFRGENSQNKRGYGLGLSIVQRIMSVHKGSIRYQALMPDINRFTLFFPGI